MYIFIFDDGQKLSTTCDDADMQACHSGLIDIIDIGDCEPRQLCYSGWEEMERADE